MGHAALAQANDLNPAKLRLVQVQVELLNTTFVGKDWYERVYLGEAGILDYTNHLKYMAKLRLTNE